MSGDVAALAVGDIHHIEYLPEQRLQMFAVVAAKFCNRLDENVVGKAARIFREHAEEDARHELVQRVALFVRGPVRIVTHDLVVELRQTARSFDVSGIFFNRLILVDACALRAIPTV